MNRALILDGFECSLRIWNGQLQATSGPYYDHANKCIPKVHPGLDHIIILGSDGFITLAALEFCRAQNISISLLDHSGEDLTIVTPARPSSALLRRAQHEASRRVRPEDGPGAIESGLALKLAKELLIGPKMAAQEAIVRERLNNPHAADQIALLRERLPLITSINDLRTLEAITARGYWTCWRDIPVLFSRPDEKKIPEYWKVFGSRISPLSGRRLSPRRSCNPPNSVLNFLSAILRAQSTIVCVAVGLDPSLGLMHRDSKQSNALALDLMEALRYLPERALLDLLRSPLSRRDFHELPDGEVRMSTSIRRTLAHLAEPWQREALAVADHIAHALSLSIPRNLHRPKRGRDLKRRRS